MTKGEGEKPSVPPGGHNDAEKSHSKHREHLLRPDDVNLKGRSLEDLRKLRQFWQIHDPSKRNQRYNLPGARRLLDRITQEISMAEQAARKKEPVQEDLASPRGVLSSTPETGGPVVTASQETPKGPDTHSEPTLVQEPEEVRPEDSISAEAVVHKETEIPAEFVMPPAPGSKEVAPAETEEEKPQISLEERIVQAEKRHFRELFGVPESATDEELQVEIQRQRLARLSLAEDADPIAIQGEESRWQSEVSALPEITDPSNEAQLAEYYRVYHVEPGSGFQAIERAMEAARLQREGLPKPFISELGETALPVPPELTGHERSDETAESGEREEPVVESEGRELPEAQGREIPQTDSEPSAAGEVQQPAPEVLEETPTERNRRLVATAVEGMSLGERARFFRDAHNLRSNIKKIEKEGTSPDDAELMGDIAELCQARLAQRPSRRIAEALAESYDLMLQQKVFEKPGYNAALLDSVGEQVSLDRALSLYQRIESRYGRVDETTAEGTVTMSSQIGEDWLIRIRARAVVAEQNPDRPEITDPEALGRLQAIMEGPALPETINERLRAAAEYLSLVRGDQQPSIAGEPVDEESLPGSLRRASTPHHRYPFLTADDEIIDAKFRSAKAGHSPEAERHEGRPTTLEQARAIYARSLNSQSRVFGRDSIARVEQLHADYQKAIDAQIEAKIREIAATLERAPEGQEISPEAEAEVRASLVEAVLGARFEEEQTLRESMRTGAEKTATQQFKKFWRKHPKARVAISLGLTGATVASAASGNILAAGIFQSMRTLVSATSATMATEGIWEKSREAFGDTKKLKTPDLSDMSDAELERRIAAHSVASAGYDKDYYEKNLGRRATIDMLMGEYRGRKDRELQKIVEAGAATQSRDDLIEALLTHSANDEKNLHRAYETRKTQDRKNAVRKWSVSVGTGMVVGGITGGLGAERLAHAAEASAAAHHPADHPEALHHGWSRLSHIFGKGPSTAHAEAAGDAAHGAAVESTGAAVTDTSHIAGVEVPGHAGGAVVSETAGATHDAAHATAAEAGHAAANAHEHASLAAGETYGGQLKDAAIRPGEGIEHALRRQLDAMPEKFGFHGNVADKAAVHEWSGGEAHRVALRQGWVAADGSETRVAFDAAHPARFILNPDGHVNVADAQTYTTHAAEHAESAASATHVSETPTVPDATHVDVSHASGTPADATHIEASTQGTTQATVTEATNASDVAQNEAAIRQINEIFGDHAIQLSEKGNLALSELRQTFQSIGESDPKVLDTLKQAVYSQPAISAFKRKALEHFIDGQPGGTADFAKDYAKAMEKLFKLIPRNEIHQDDTIGKIMNRLSGSLEYAAKESA